MRIIFVFIVIFFLCLCSYSATAIGSAGALARYESRYIIDMPTAGVIPKGTFSVNGTAFEGGGLAVDFSASPFKNFNLGLSYSGYNIIGSGTITWQNIPGVHLKFRIIDETLSFPAITLGVNTQGKGFFSNANKRFQTQSPGAFLAVSKQFGWDLGAIALHTGINYSFEPNPNSRKPNFWIGIEQAIKNQAALNIEYNANLDDAPGIYMKNRGLLNAAFRWSLANGVTLEFQFRDLLENLKHTDGFSRNISLEYIVSF